MAAAHRLVGRETQVELLEGLLDDLGQGRGGAVFLAGEAGIGKTRLAEEVVALAERRGARTAWTTSWKDAGAPPLWPWTQLLRLLGLSVDLEQAGTASPDAADAARFEQFETVAGALRGATEAAPVVAVLDDLQWADVASLRLLAFVVEALRDRPCLLIGTPITASTTPRVTSTGRRSSTSSRRSGCRLSRGWPTIWPGLVPPQ